MKKHSRFILLSALLSCSQALPAALSLDNLSSLKKYITALPEQTQTFLPTFVTLEKLRATAATYRAQRVLEQRAASWAENTRNVHGIFAQKLIIPPQSDVHFFGDIHGNIHSLVRMLDACIARGTLNDQLVIIKPNTYFVFLGDYVDRGFYSTETLVTLLQFAIKNPGKVILLRGNHEDEMMNRRYGFGQELSTKFPELSATDSSFIFTLFGMMPSALYLGSGTNNHFDMIQCCHGGFEIGYNPRTLLEHPSLNCYQGITKLHRVEPVRLLPQSIKKAIIDIIPENEICDCTLFDPTSPVHLGLLWNDFIAKDTQYTSSTINYTEGRGWAFGKSITKHILATHSPANTPIRSVFRAHQHHGDMLDMLKLYKGIAPLWNGLVYTFVSSPINGLHIPFDSFGILTTAASFDQWKLKHAILAPNHVEYRDIQKPFGAIS